MNDSSFTKTTPASTTGDTETYAIATRELFIRGLMADVVNGETNEELFIPFPMDPSFTSKNFVERGDLLFTRIIDLPVYTSRMDFVSKPTVFSSFDGVTLSIPKSRQINYVVKNGHVMRKSGSGGEPIHFGGQEKLDLYREAFEELFATLTFVGVSLATDTFLDKNNPDEVRHISVRVGGYISIENSASFATEPGQVMVLDAEAMAKMALNMDSGPSKRNRIMRPKARRLACLKKFDRTKTRTLIAEAIKETDATKREQKLKEADANLKQWPIARVVSGNSIGELMEVVFS